MAKTILLINGHPDPSPERLCQALADAYIKGGQMGGHAVHAFHIGEIEFPLLVSAGEFTEGQIPPELQPMKSALLKANHVVIIYPLWLGMLPAKLKACLEQVFRPGVAISYTDANKFPQKLLKGKSARIIVTMGMPGIFYRLVFRAHSLKALTNNMLKFCGIGPVRTTVYGAVESASDRKRSNWLNQVRQWGTKAL